MEEDDDERLEEAAAAAAEYSALPRARRRVATASPKECADSVLLRRLRRVPDRRRRHRALCRDFDVCEQCHDGNEEEIGEIRDARTRSSGATCRDARRRRGGGGVGGQGAPAAQAADSENEHERRWPSR